PVVGDGQVNIQASRSRIKEIRQGLRGRRRIRIRDIKQQPIRKNASSPRNHKLSLGKHLLIDDQLTESPSTKLQRLQPEIERVLNKPVLRLQVLRSEERPLGPDHWLQLLHRIPSDS